MGSGKLLHKAYKKYGLENFNKEVIDFYNSEDELNRGEIYWIAKFNSTDQNIGYNLTYGGDGVLGHIPSQETRQKISSSKKGQTSPNKGKTFIEEHRRKLSESHKGKNRGENNGMYRKSPANKGVPMSEEQKRKISLYWQRRKLEKLNKQNNG